MNPPCAPTTFLRAIKMSGLCSWATATACSMVYAGTAPMTFGKPGKAAGISMLMATNFKPIFVYLLARAFLAPGLPVSFPLISVLASGRDFGHIRRLQHLEALQANAAIEIEAAQLVSCSELV